VTKPTKKMLEAMCASPVGDDVYEVSFFFLSFKIIKPK